jgi:hypothetical protein
MSESQDYLLVAIGLVGYARRLFIYLRCRVDGVIEKVAEIDSRSAVVARG